MSMTADDKAGWARIFTDCPTWCDGDCHLDGSTRHQSEFGGPAHVTVGVESRDDGTVGVYLNAEGGHFPALTAEETAEVIALLRRAEEIVTAH